MEDINQTLESERELLVHLQLPMDNLKLHVSQSEWNKMTEESKNLYQHIAVEGVWVKGNGE